MPTDREQHPDLPAEAFDASGRYIRPGNRKRKKGTHEGRATYYATTSDEARSIAMPVSRGRKRRTRT